MSIRDEMVILCEVPPFRDLDKVKLELLAFVSEHVTFEAGDVILKQGDTGDAVYVLIDGTVDVAIDCDGETKFTGELGRHAFFGEIAVVRQRTRAATLTARTKARVLKVSSETLHCMMDDIPDLRQRIDSHIDNAGYLLD